MSYIGIILAFVLGYSLLCLVIGRFSFLETIGLSFPIGMGGVTLIMFTLIVLGINLSNRSLILTEILFIVTFNYRNILKPKQIIERIRDTSYKEFFRLGDFNFIWLILFLSIAALLFFVTKKSLYVPTFSTDSVSSFDLYAKAIAHEGKLINSLIYDKSVGYGAAYPPLTSLSLAYSYIFGFESSKIIPALFFISFIISFYGFSLRNNNSLAAVFATLGTVAAPELLAQSALNTTSVPQAMYASLGIISIILWNNTKETKYYYLAIVLLALNGWIRSEGIVYIGAAFLYCLYVQIPKKKISTPFILLFLSMLPFLIWQIFLKMNSSVMDSFIQVEMQLVPNLDGEHFGKILAGTKKNFFHPSYYGITAYAFILAGLLNIYAFYKKKQSLLILGLVLVPLIAYLVLLNQLHLRADTIESIMNASAKRFFFGIVAIMWFYIVQVYPFNQIFVSLETFLSVPQKNKRK